MNINDELNKKEVWKDSKCVRCGRQYPDTILNIEGHIHHNIPIVCLDVKDCRRAQRKLKR